MAINTPVRPQAYRLSAATGMHRGDRSYQQDQVAFFAHPHVPGCGMAILADGMGGKSGGRKAADQVIMVASQVYERFAPTSEDPEELLETLVRESHQMIRLTAMTAEEEPHSTLAGFVIGPDRSCHVVHAGDSRVYHFRGPELQMRTFDHSLVQRMVDEGRLTEEEALTHPQSNLLTGCLGTNQDPPLSLENLGKLDIGDTLLVCSDGLWHYFSTQELGAIANALAPREASELLIDKARQRARGGGDNISVAIVRIESLNKQAPKPKV
jgi:PPM family protein phosphatase